MTNCQWLNSKLELYFCDGLSDEELQRCQTHLATCAECSRQVDSLRDLDKGIRQVFERRLRLAQQAPQAGSRSRVLKIALAGVGLAVAATLLGLGLTAFQQPPGSQALRQPPGLPESTPEVVKDKRTESAEINRAKPEEGSRSAMAPQPNLDLAAPDGPEFAITDAAGYTATLETYRGRVLLFGVVSSDQKAAVANLQQLYNAFGSNPGIRMLGVSPRGNDDLAGATFPRFFNHGSKLLGVREGQFLLIDAAGTSRLEGSLSDAGEVARLRNQLGQLGIR